MSQEEGYTILGPVVYNGNVLVRRPDDDRQPQTVAYMNMRAEQKKLLETYYGDSVEIVSLYPTALAYALENGAVDAVLIDLVTALKLDYPMRSISQNSVSSVMMVRNELIGTEQLNSFLHQYNEAVRELEHDDTLLKTTLRGYCGEDLSEEVLSHWLKTWRSANVRFGSLKAATAGPVS